MKQVYTLLMVLWTLNVALSVYSQCNTAVPLNVINPSFEGPTGPHITPAPWNTCGITPDTQPGSWGVNLPPSDGSSYVGFVNGGPSWQEGASQALSGPMIAGNEYTFTIDLATTNSMLGGLNPAPTFLVIHGAHGLCQRAELLWTSPIISHTNWQTYTVTFTPTQNFTHIYFSIGVNSPRNSYIMLDNIGPIIPSSPNVKITSHANGDSEQCGFNIFGTISDTAYDSVVLSGSFIGSPTHAIVNGRNWNQNIQFSDTGIKNIYVTYYLTDSITEHIKKLGIKQKVFLI